MSYVVYDVATTRLIGDAFKSLAAAKAGVTRAVKAGRFARNDVAVTDSINYYQNVERMVERVNLLSGKKYMESVNTPSYCSPSSEAYWSM
jgi:methyl coenzyme M reductase subunit D